MASGPSAGLADFNLLRDVMPVMAINTSYKLVLWADVLYACDAKWWRLYAGAPDFLGLKVSQDVEAQKYPDIKLVRCDRIGTRLRLEPGTIGAGHNSGFQALNLAVQFGAKRILLIGFDMRTDHGEHWHPRHPPPLSNPLEVPRWRFVFDAAALTLKELGVEVINCSEISALACYPKLPLMDAIRCS